MSPGGGEPPFQHRSQPPAERDYQHRPVQEATHQEQQKEVSPSAQPQRASFRITASAAGYQPHPHSPPVRDAASLKGVKYGAGHDKYPSWPTSAAADAPAATRTPPTGGSHRSKSWTDHTHYPKESVVLYTRAYMKRPHRQQQLKPVFESERGMDYRAEAFEGDSRRYARDYGLASPPERDTPRALPDLADYSTAYEVKMVMQQDAKMPYQKSCQPGKESKKLTQSELEEYTKSYEEALTAQHQKQSSYAQSEGYHSYVSSTDSTSTPFLDRLRREADASVSRSDSGLSGAAGGAGWGEAAARGDRDSVVTTSSGSGSSSETLKWHGSLSDVSVASSSQSSASKQLIAHSAKVKTPQRHGSESVLYIARAADSDNEHRAVPPGNCQKHLKLFPVSTYAVPEPAEQRQATSNRMTSSYSPPQMSVAERVSELERQSKYSAYQDARRQTRDPGLKAQQKSALLSFYERHQQKENKQSWRSEPQLASSQPPPPPPQVRPQPSSRRASSASDYADWRDRDLPNPQPEDPVNPEPPKLPHPLQVPNSARFSPNSVLDGPVIVGPVISLDDWVPERPPKNAKLLRNVFPDLYHQHERLPSPDLPLPSPPTVLEDEVFNDEPFPPPPSEIVEWKYEQEVPERLEKPNNLTQSPLAENVAKPMPIRSNVIKSTDTNMEKNHSHAPIREHPVMRPSDLPLNPTNVLPFSHNQYKKTYTNFNEKVLRNSFRSPNEGAPHIGLVQDIRASMRHYRSNTTLQNKMASPQKPLMSAQKMLFRSTTVDESPSPKRPINPFLRSTSLRQSECIRNSIPSIPQTQRYPCDRTQHSRYSYGPNAFNGDFCDKPRETVGHFRPECDKSKSVVSKIEQLQQILKGNVETKKSDVCSPVLSPSSLHGAISKKTPYPGPPPLYPKQTTPDSSGNRGNENVCYAPAAARAKLPDPSAGSYKSIQPRDELPAAMPTRRALPDLLLPTADTRPPYTTFDYIDRRSCEKLLSLPLEYSKKSSVLIARPETANESHNSPLLENQVFDYNDRRSSDKLLSLPLEYSKKSPGLIASPVQTNESQDSPLLEKRSDIAESKVPVTKPVEDSRDVISEDIVPEKAVGKLSKETVIVPDDETEAVKEETKAIKEETETVKEETEAVKEETEAVKAVTEAVNQETVGELELPLETRWEETVPADKELAYARRRLVRALPPDHQLLNLLSLSQDQRSPIDFIRDFFGETTSSDNDIKRATVGPATTELAEVEEEETPPSLDELKMNVVERSLRLVASMEAAALSTAAAAAANDARGAAVLARLAAPPTPLAAKFSSHHTEVYHISALMAALSARLARTYDQEARQASHAKQAGQALDAKEASQASDGKQEAGQASDAKQEASRASDAKREARQASNAKPEARQASDAKREARQESDAKQEARQASDAKQEARQASDAKQEARQASDAKQMEELHSKRRKLEEQLEEARSLKENIDGRAATLAEKLRAALDADTYRDYRLFMAVKPRLVIRARHLQYRLDYERDRLAELQRELQDR